MATIVESYPKAPFSSCWVLSKKISNAIFASLVWLGVGLNPGFRDHWRTLYSWSNNSKVLQYFGNVRHNLAASDSFVEVVTMRNQVKCRALPILSQWYSCRIYLYGLEHGLRIYVFMPTNPCLIVEIFAARLKFLEASGYYTGINSAFTFRIINHV